ncbi:flagellar basal body-associated FliL family protein [Roseivivax isoporae]|uniref:Flagellar protein FliL n=1 Tax=Roseivivax isoporae LMG 25204 TaxID=1449351 RepID=X7F7V5_9RHOB|nr:flagellar basal body-associated FliL family protein [Roseivivax isoporae]ETX28885.1 hypothetical protein RISW2_04020 [Roseivivax isoporae LMG 25204]
MFRILCLLVGLPTICVAAGFGAGLVFETPNDHASTSPATRHAAQERPAPHAETHAEAPAEDADIVQAAARSDETALPKPMLEGRVIRVGRMTVPVRKARSTSYIVVEFGIAMESPEQAQAYGTLDHTIRFRDALLVELTERAKSDAFKGPAIDTEALSAHLRDALAELQPGVEDVLLLQFYKHDVPNA